LVNQVLLELEAIQAVWDHQANVESLALLVTPDLLDASVCALSSSKHSVSNNTLTFVHHNIPKSNNLI